MSAPDQLPLFPEAASLVRIRPERNERGTYRVTAFPAQKALARLVYRRPSLGLPDRL